MHTKPWSIPGWHPPTALGTVGAAGESATGNPDSDPGLRPRGTLEKSPFCSSNPGPWDKPSFLGISQKSEEESDSHSLEA